MKRELTYQEKVQRDILKQVKGFRIPSFGRIKSIGKICGRCKVKKVVNHHYLCDSCWRDKDIEDKIIKIIGRYRVGIKDIHKIKNILYNEYKVYRSYEIVHNYVMKIFQRRNLKGGVRWE